MQNKWISGSLVIIVLAVVVVAFINNLSFKGEILIHVQSDYNNENNVHEVQFDYSLQDGHYRSVSF